MRKHHILIKKRLLILIFPRCDHPCCITPSIILPDHNADTVWSLLALLRTGTITVFGETERLRVTHLQRFLSCGFSMSSPAYNTSFRRRIKEKWTLRSEVFYKYLHSIVLHCTTFKLLPVLHFPSLHCPVLYCPVLYCPVLVCTFLYCPFLYCTVLCLYCPI